MELNWWREREKADGWVRGGETCVHRHLAVSRWAPGGTVGHCIRKKAQACNHPAVRSPRGGTVRCHDGRLKTLAEEGPGPASTSVSSESKRSKNTADKEEVGAARRWLTRCLLPWAPAAPCGSWPGCCSHGGFTLAVCPARNVPPSLDSRPPQTPLLEGLLESLP